MVIRKCFCSRLQKNDCLRPIPGKIRGNIRPFHSEMAGCFFCRNLSEKQSCAFELSLSAEEYSIRAGKGKSNPAALWNFSNGEDPIINWKIFLSEVRPSILTLDRTRVSGKTESRCLAV